MVGEAGTRPVASVVTPAHAWRKKMWTTLLAASRKCGLRRRAGHVRDHGAIVASDRRKRR